MAKASTKRASAVYTQPIAFPPFFSSIANGAARTGISKSAMYAVIKILKVRIVKFGSRSLIPEDEMHRVAEAIDAGEFAEGIFKGAAGSKAGEGDTGGKAGEGAAGGKAGAG